MNNHAGLLPGDIITCEKRHPVLRVKSAVCEAQTMNSRDFEALSPKTEMSNLSIPRCPVCNRAILADPSPKGTLRVYRPIEIGCAG